MSEPEQWHCRQVESFRAATHGQAVTITSNPPHLTTLPTPPCPNKRSPQAESFRQRRPTADVTDDRRYEEPQGYDIAGPDNPERSRMLVEPVLHVCTALAVSVL